MGRGGGLRASPRGGWREVAMGTFALGGELWKQMRPRCSTAVHCPNGNCAIPRLPVLEGRLLTLTVVANCIDDGIVIGFDVMDHTHVALVAFEAS